MDDTTADLPFPLRGLHLAGETLRPPGLTTPVGTNCRAVDPIAHRLRGGSRPGLVKAFAEQVSGTHAVQHLNVIVDPTVDALIPDAPGVGFTDPTEPGRNPLGRLVRDGGSGVQPSKNKPVPPPPPPPPPTPIQLVQSQLVNFTGTDSTARTISFTNPPASGNTLIAIVGTLSSVGPAVGLTVAGSGVSTGYTDGAGLAEMLNFGLYHDLQFFYRRATSGGEQDVTITPAFDVAVCAVLLEYKNMPASPLDAKAAASDDTLPTAWSPGSVLVNGANELVLAAYLSCCVDATGSFTPTAPQVDVVNDPFGLNRSDLILFVTHHLPVNTVSETPAATMDFGCPYAAIATTWKNG